MDRGVLRFISRNRLFTLLISTDIKAGGISTMLGIHAAALIKQGYKISVILYKTSDAISSIEYCTKKIHNKDNFLTVHKYNWLDSILLKFGLSKWILNIVNKCDICFVHNARLIDTIKKNTIKPVFAVNHTAKISQLKYFKKADMIFSVNHIINDQLIDLGVSKNKCVYCPNVLIDLPEFKLKNFETNTSLYSNESGFSDIKRLITDSKRVLVNDGLLILENGFNQSAKVSSLLEKNYYKDIDIILDYNGVNRFTLSRYS